MSYSAESISQMAEGFATVESRFLKLREDLIMRNYRTVRGQEFAVHGYCRRLRTLALTTRHTFEMLPPEFDGVPEKEVLDDVTIQVQAFVFNIFGAIDNLAWTWFYERDPKREDGKDVPATWVGLAPGNTFLISSLSAPFQERISELKEWFRVIEGYRHGLAHRIPLYIPPYSVPENKEAEYKEIGAKILDAMTRHEWDEMEKHEADQLAMHVFHPQIMHSFEEGARTISFHPQMLADFGLVEDFGRRMLDELNALGA
jgi:hypothetical protein